MLKLKKKEIDLIPLSEKNFLFSNNFLVFLFCFVFLIIAIDLSSDLSLQKNEMGNTIEIFEDCISDIILPSDFLSKIERQLLFEIPAENILPDEKTFEFSVKDRGPPEINS